MKDLPLPWANHQIESAKRTFLERHPLAKHKDQAAMAKPDSKYLLTCPSNLYASLQLEPCIYIVLLLAACTLQTAKINFKMNNVSAT